MMVDVTLRAIAESAGVSPAAASLALNGRPGVGDETRERVLAAAQRLGYAPRRAARGGRSYRLALVVEKLPLPVLQDIFYAEVIAGMQSAVQAAGHSLQLHVLGESEHVAAAVRTLQEQNVDGLMLLGGGDISDDDVRHLATARVPLVLVDNYVPDEKLNCVLPDNVAAGFAATRHLIGLGHRRIAVLEGPAKYKTLGDRLEGYLGALAEADLPIDPTLMIKPISGTPKKGYLQMQELLAQPDPPTGVVAISDKTAFGAMAAIREAGLRIPDDVSIVGIDDVLESRHTLPPLTTVGVPKREFGQAAIEKLLRRIKEPTALPTKTVLYTELVVRSTTGPPSR
jgi:DNA-binding LacI/PurR family transcriptional regulator